MKTGKPIGSEYRRNGVSASQQGVTPTRRHAETAWSAAILCFVTASLWAADFQVSASLDRNQIALNEQAVLSVTVSGSGSTVPEPQLPGLPDFQVYNAGKSQNFTWINGKASASVTHNFVLTPSKEGQFTIPPVRVTDKAETVESAALSLAVSRGDPAAVQGSARPEGAAPAAASAQAAPAVFITGTVDKNIAYVGEPVVFTFRLHNRVPLRSQPRYQPPELTGFWAEDLPPQRNFQMSHKGMPYNVTEVQTALFPSVPGKARVGSAQLTVNLENFGTDPFGSNFFGQFFGRGEEKTLRTEAVPITVRALPSPKPAGFNGAIGVYSLTAQLDKSKIAVGQPLTLSLTIAGRGHIKSLPDLPLPPLTNIRTFDASAATNIEKKDGMVQGSKVFKTVLIPTASGELKIPSISFTYFDLTERAYKTVQSRPLAIQVSPAPEGATGSMGNAVSGSAPVSGLAQPGIKRLGEDIRYVHTPKEISNASEPLYTRTWFRLFHVGLLSLLVLGALARLYFRLFMSNTVFYRFRKALERAKADIQKTDDFLTRKDMKAASSHLANVLQDYLAAKLGIERRTRSLRQIVEGLKARGLTSHTGEKIRNSWETLDLYQFAPAQVQVEEIRASMQTVTHVMEEAEKEIQWPR